MLLRNMTWIDQCWGSQIKHRTNFFSVSMCQISKKKGWGEKEKWLLGRQIQLLPH